MQKRVALLPCAKLTIFAQIVPDQEFSDYSSKEVRVFVIYIIL